MRPWHHITGKRFGQQTPRRWGWGTPLKKRTATRITAKLEPQKILSTSYLDSPETAYTSHGGLDRQKDAALADSDRSPKPARS